MLTQEISRPVIAKFPDGETAEIPVKWVEALLPGLIDEVEMYEGGPCVPVCMSTGEDLGRMLLEFGLRQSPKKRRH